MVGAPRKLNSSIHIPALPGGSRVSEVLSRTMPTWPQAGWGESPAGATSTPTPASSLRSSVAVRLFRPEECVHRAMVRWILPPCWWAPCPHSPPGGPQGAEGSPGLPESIVPGGARRECRTSCLHHNIAPGAPPGRATGVRHKDLVNVRGLTLVNFTRRARARCVVGNVCPGPASG